MSAFLVFAKSQCQICLSLSVCLKTSVRFAFVLFWQPKSQLFQDDDSGIAVLTYFES